MRNYKQFFAIIKKMDRDKESIVFDFTNERTTSLGDLSDEEYEQLMRLLQQFNTVPAGDAMRKKMISLAKQMQWGANSYLIVKELDKWLIKQKFKKTLMQLNVPQLGLMLAVFEQKVYGDYLKGLNK